MSDMFKLGEHEQAITTLSQDMQEVKRTVGRIEKALSEQKGERRVALWFAGAAGGAVATGLAKLLLMVFSGKHA